MEGGSSSINHHVDRRVAMMAGHFRAELVDSRDVRETFAGTDDDDVGVHHTPIEEITRLPTAALSKVGGFQVAVLGAAGGIGQPLSLLMKQCPLVDTLHLFDIANVAGVAADLSHVNTRSCVQGFTGPEQLGAALSGEVRGKVQRQHPWPFDVKTLRTYLHFSVTAPEQQVTT